MVTTRHQYTLGVMIETGVEHTAKMMATRVH